MPHKYHKDIIKFAMELEASSNEECRLATVQLLALLSQDMTNEQAENYFKIDYLSIFKEGSLRIKKKVIHYCPAIAKHVSDAFLCKEIIDEFITSIAKEVTWALRKACVDVLPSHSEIAINRKDVLANLMLTLTKDSNKLVRVEALKVVPSFIAKFQHPSIPDKLV